MRKEILVLGIIGICIVLVGMVFAIEPNGASISPGTAERAPTDINGSLAAWAGNVTFMDVTGYSLTQAWQGYFGNVTGAITLEDGSGNALYNWSVVSPQGEIYGTANATVDWTNIQCFNFTATGTNADDSGQRGDTSLFGTNLTSLETQYNIATDDEDGVNETFTLSGAGTHDEFFTNNLNFSEGECLSTRVFGDTGEGVSNEFEEVLLYDPDTTAVVFATILEDNVGGFDQATYDFEMLVLEDGHNEDTSATTYYFWVEIE